MHLLRSTHTISPPVGVHLGTGHGPVLLPLPHHHHHVLHVTYLAKIVCVVFREFSSCKRLYRSFLHSTRLSLGFSNLHESVCSIIVTSSSHQGAWELSYSYSTVPEIYGYKQPSPLGCALGLRSFMDHKSLSTVVYNMLMLCKNRTIIVYIKFA